MTQSQGPSNALPSSSAKVRQPPRMQSRIDEGWGNGGAGNPIVPDTVPCIEYTGISGSSHTPARSRVPVAAS